MCIYVIRCWERCVESVRSHYVGWQWCTPKFMSEQYFFARKLDLGKEVVSLVVTGGISGRWNEMMKTGGWSANIWKKGS